MELCIHKNSKSTIGESLILDFEIPYFCLQKFFVWGSKSLTLLGYNQHLVV